MGRMIYRFGDCQLDDQRYELRRGGVACRLEPQVFEVLAYLVRNRDRVVPRTELLDEVWKHRFVSRLGPGQPGEGGPQGSRRQRPGAGR